MQQTQPRRPLAEKFALSTERLGPLPLVNHFISRLGLIELLDQYVPTIDRRCAVPHATALGVLLRSIVVEREPIYRQVETVHGFAPAMYGLGEQDLEHLGDDRLGRALDRLYDADRGALLTAVVLAVGKCFGVSGISTAIQSARWRPGRSSGYGPSSSPPISAPAASVASVPPSRRSAAYGIGS